MNFKKQELAAAGMRPICPECGAEELKYHRWDCRIAQYVARLELWKTATKD